MDIKIYRATIEIIKTIIRIVHYIIFIPIIGTIFIIALINQILKNEIKSNDNGND